MTRLRPGWASMLPDANEMRQRGCTMRFVSTAYVLAKCMLKYSRISWQVADLAEPVSSQMPMRLGCTMTVESAQVSARRTLKYKRISKWAADLASIIPDANADVQLWIQEFQNAATQR